MCAPNRPVVPMTPPSLAVLAHNERTFPFAMGIVILVNIVDMMDRLVASMSMDVNVEN
jgi:hypothetical protein